MRQWLFVVGSSVRVKCYLPSHLSPLISHLSRGGGWLSFFKEWESVSIDENQSVARDPPLVALPFKMFGVYCLRFLFYKTAPFCVFCMMHSMLRGDRLRSTRSTLLSLAYHMLCVAYDLFNLKIRFDFTPMWYVTAVLSRFRFVCPLCLVLHVGSCGGIDDCRRDPRRVQDRPLVPPEAGAHRQVQQEAGGTVQHWD